MGSSKGGGKVPAPNYSQDYEKGIQIQLKYLPHQLQQELAMRQQYDPQYIAQALQLQQQYDPWLAIEQQAAVQRRDPQWFAAHQAFGDRVNQVLQRGYVDPQRAAAYGALGKQVTGDTLRGSTASPAMKRDMTQAILSRSPNLSYGEAQNMAAAVYTGQRGQALEQQRQQAANQFLGQQSESDLALTAAGRYMSSPTLTSMINQTPGVTPPSANRYVNPNAGYQGAQYGLQNYQNLVAQQQMQQGSNPWTNALGTVGGIAGNVIGGIYGGPAGSAIGGYAGGMAGNYAGSLFSDVRLKQNVSRTGLSTADGIPIVEYDFDGKRWRGVLAQEVQKVRPDAVVTYPNGFLGVFYSKLGIEREEI